MTLSKQEQNTVRILERLINHTITNSQAASELDITVRQVIRKKKTYLEEGIGSVVHKNKGRKTNTGVPQEIEDYLVEMYCLEYPGWNFCHFKDALKDIHGIDLSYTYLYQLLTENGIKSPKKRRKRQRAHPIRPRRENAGELVQMDASKHIWITLSGNKYQLHGAIDDATNQVLSLFLDDEETALAYQIVLCDIVQRYGLPECLYTDYRTVFQSSKRLSEEEELRGVKAKDTRFTAMCRHNGINITSTSDPRAKGRIERLWGTLQDRLVKELEKANITTKKEANRYIRKTFLPKYNARFASNIDYSRNRFVEVPASFDYLHQLALVDIRQVINHSYISYKGQGYTVINPETNKAAYIYGAPKVEVCALPNGKLEIKHQDKYYQLHKLSTNIPRPKHPTKKKLTPAELSAVRSRNGTNSKSPWHNWNNSNGHNPRELSK